MKKYLPALVLTALFIPAVAFASWWNPFTWNIFSSYQSNPQLQIINTTTLPVQTLANNSTTTATTTIPTAITTEVVVATTSTSKINIPIKKVTPPVKTPTPPVSATYRVPVSSSTVCPTSYNCSVINQPVAGTTTSNTTSLVPIITSIGGGSSTLTQGGSGYISGQHLSSVTSVYLSPTNSTTQKINLIFSLSADTSLEINISNTISPGQYYLYASNDAGVSDAFTVSVAAPQVLQPQPSVQSVQTYQSPVISQPAQTVSTPPVSQGPSPAEQAACQQAYDQGTAALQLSYQSQYAQDEAQGEQQIADFLSTANPYSAGTGASAKAMAANTDLTLSSLTAQYNLNLSNEKMALQECLNP